MLFFWGKKEFFAKHRKQIVDLDTGNRLEVHDDIVLPAPSLVLFLSVAICFTWAAFCCFVVAVHWLAFLWQFFASSIKMARKRKKSEEIWAKFTV